MVKEVKSNGRLKLSQLGGFAWNTIEGEGCTIFTRFGRSVRGSILLTKASTHVFATEVSETNVLRIRSKSGWMPAPIPKKRRLTWHRRW